MVQLTSGGGGSGGGSFEVDPAAVAGAGSSIAGVSHTVQGLGSELMSAMASAQGALGDPSAEGGMSDLMSAWTLPLGALAAVLGKAAQATAASAEVYSNTDSAVARAAR